MASVVSSWSWHLWSLCKRELACEQMVEAIRKASRYLNTTIYLLKIGLWRNRILIACTLHDGYELFQLWIISLLPEMKVLRNWCISTVSRIRVSIPCLQILSIMNMRFMVEPWLKCFRYQLTLTNRKSFPSFNTWLSRLPYPLSRLSALSFRTTYSSLGKHSVPQIIINDSTSQLWIHQEEKVFDIKYNRSESPDSAQPSNTSRERDL